MVVVVVWEFVRGAYRHIEGVVVLGFEDVSDSVVRGEFPPASLDGTGAGEAMATTG